MELSADTIQAIAAVVGALASLVWAFRRSRSQGG